MKLLRGARGLGKAETEGGGARGGASAAAVNEPLAFINFVASHPLAGSVVEGPVVGLFTSHGAMVEDPMPDGGVLHCYVPMSGSGDLRRRGAAREVLKRGGSRR